MSDSAKVEANSEDTSQVTALKSVTAMSPSTRQAAKEQAEAAVLAEVEAELEARRARSAKLRKLRLSQTRK